MATLSIRDNSSDREVLRECLFALQGVTSGTRIRFDNNNDFNTQVWVDRSLPGDNSELGSGSLDALSICAEAGWLYRRIKAYVERITTAGDASSTSTAPSNNGGTSIQRALACSLQNELNSYQQFLAQYQLSNNHHHHNLRLILCQMQGGPLQRLQYLATLTDGLPPQQQLLQALYQHATRHGDSRHNSLMEPLLQAASRPWFDWLFQWTTQGLLLSDDGEEFFVSEQSTSKTSSTTSLWTDRYQLHLDRVPTGILETDLVEPAFIIGKGINFIRQCLLDDEWSLDLSALSPKSSSSANGDDWKEKLGFCYASDDDTAQRALLRNSLHRAAKLVHSHILTCLHEKHSLMQHMFALKQFLLLGQGDFFSALMDGIHEGRVVGVHSLTAIVDTAVRSTNASSFSDDVLSRLHVKLLSDNEEEGPLMSFEDRADAKTVWDLFQLEYKVPDPVQTIVHAKIAAQYQRMCRFLFGLRRVEFLLNLTWRQSSVLQHALQATAAYNSVTAPAAALSLLRHISTTRQAMRHFVGNFKSYIMFEVVEGEWTELLGTLAHAETLDEVMEAHNDYLEGVCRKGLLTQVPRLLALVREFCQYQEDLLGSALQAAECAAEKRRLAEDRLEQGEWGFSSERERSEEASFFGLADAEKRVHLDRLSRDFHKQVVALLQSLDAKLNGGPVYEERSTPGTPSDDRTEEGYDESGQEDLDALRFLTFQLDSNKFYSVQQSEGFSL